MGDNAIKKNYSIVQGKHLQLGGLPVSIAAEWSRLTSYFVGDGSTQWLHLFIQHIYPISAQ